MPDCRECQFFEKMTKCNVYNNIVPYHMVCENPCREFRRLPDPTQVLKKWIKEGAPVEAIKLLDAIEFNKFDDLDDSIRWIYTRKDSIEVRAVQSHINPRMIF